MLSRMRTSLGISWPPPTLSCRYQKRGTSVPRWCRARLLPRPCPAALVLARMCWHGCMPAGVSACLTRETPLLLMHDETHA